MYSWMDRIPMYPSSLVLAARKHPNFLQGLQRHLAAFLAESAAKRYALPAMPREVCVFLVNAGWRLLAIAGGLAAQRQNVSIEKQEHHGSGACACFA